MEGLGSSVLAGEGLFGMKEIDRGFIKLHGNSLKKLWCTVSFELKI